MAQRLLRQQRQAFRSLPEVDRLRRHVDHEARGWRQHERVRRSAMNTSLNTARPGAPRTSTRAPWNSTVTTAASGDPEGSAAAGNADSDITGTNDSVSADAGNTNWPKRARRRQSCTCWGRQPWRRATSVTIAPGSRLSAGICAFKSSGQRLRPAPANTSIRGDNGRLMSSEWSSIVSTLPEDDSSNGALKTPHKQSKGSRRYAYERSCATYQTIETFGWRTMDGVKLARLGDILQEFADAAFKREANKAVRAGCQRPDSEPAPF